MDTVIIAALSVTMIGAACAVMLSIASKIMAVKIDERIEKIQKVLPGTNCGSCGFPGCSGYATALVEDPSIKASLCTWGGADAINQISAILGVEAEAFVSKAAVIHCGGDSAARQKKMNYKGIESCAAANLLFGGQGACTYGCLGYGDCQLVCPSKAVFLEDGLARIDPELCTGCALCVKACPNGIISIERAPAKTVIACSNIERGAVVRNKCTKCCVGCGRCMRECPKLAVVVENNLAVIDYEKCNGCGHCAKICLTKCILHE